MIRRLDDWPARLRRFLEDRKRTPFAWGRNDCCLFAADAVLAITGTDAAAAWRGYRTARGAATRLDRHGGVAGLMREAAAAHGWAEILPAFARRGDVVLLVHPAPRHAVDALGIVDLSGRRAAVPDADGLAAVPLIQAVTAWRIG